jgi:glycosyltransferase involved in cell wall biosynthesis
VEISIVTPSYNMLPYLKCCAASIADQNDAHIEHIVVDAKSTDGTVDWLSAQSKIRYISEPDNGMYDAVNKGLILASGDILAYLNCDEQYLPGTLSFVKEYFDTHPDVDVLFGDFLAVDPDGSLVSYRKAFQPRRYYIQATHLYVFTCTMFFRRKLIEEGMQFDKVYRDIADSLFVVDLLRKGYKVRHIKHYMSVFTMTGNNRFISEGPTEDIKRMDSERGNLFRKIMKHPLNILRVTEKLLHGCYFEKFPILYSIYICDNYNKRIIFTITKGSPFWNLTKRLHG